MKAKLLPLFFIGYLFLLTFPLFASSTDTTIYLSSIEKNLESGEIKVYYGAGNSSALRTIRRDGTSFLLYIHPDYLDSTVVVTNNTKNIVSNVKYYPYGNEVTPTNNITDKLYTNQRKDSSSNLYFYNARYYNPNTTHFISADKAEGPNRYSYVSNNPIMKNDPSGNMVVNDGGASSNKLDLKNPFKNNFDLTNSSVLGISKTSTIKFSYPVHIPNPISNTIKLEGNQFYSLDFNNKYFDDLAIELEVDQASFGYMPDSSYAIGLTHSIYKKIPYHELSAKSQSIIVQYSRPDVLKEYIQKADEDRKKSKTFSDLLINNRAVCGDKAILLSYYLERQGISSEVMYVSDISKKFFHAAVSATVESGIVFLDPTWDLVKTIDISKPINDQISMQYKKASFISYTMGYTAAINLNQGTSWWPYNSE